MVREGTNASCWADRFCSSIRPLRSNRGNCDIGEKSISCPQMPGLHQQSYTEQGLLSCPHCSRSFKGQSNYQRHLLVHTGECPHRCPVCDRGFSQAANLQRHLRIHVEKGGFPAVAPLLQYQVSQQVALEEYGESRGPQSQSVFTLGQKGQESSTVDRSMAEMRSETVGTRGGREERKKEAQEEVCDVGPEFKSCSFQDECGAAGKGGESVMPEWKVGVRQPHVLGNLLGERWRKEGETDCMERRLDDGQNVGTLRECPLHGQDDKDAGAFTGRGNDARPSVSAVGTNLVGPSVVGELSGVQISQTSSPHFPFEAQAHELHLPQGAVMTSLLPAPATPNRISGCLSSRIYQCPKCSRQFACKSNLKRHWKVHTGERPYSCPVCGRKFSQGSNCLRHQQSHLSLGAGVNGGLGRKVSGNYWRQMLLGDYDKASEDVESSSQLLVETGTAENQLQGELGEEGSLTDGCGQADPNLDEVNVGGGEAEERDRMMNDKRECSKQRCPSAAVCQNQDPETSMDKEKTDLKSQYHQRSITKQDPLCEVSNQDPELSLTKNSNSVSFAGTDWNAISSALHEDSDRPFYTCNHCGRRFTCKSNLHRHFSVHTGEKPYRCIICGKSFNQISNCRRHLRSHSLDCRYHRPLHHQAFTRIMHLPSHLQTRGGVLSEQEGGEKLYSSGRKGNGRSAAWEGGDAGLLEMMEIGIEGRQVSQRGKGGLESSAGEVSSEVGKEVWESGEMEQAHWSAVEAHEGEVAEGDKRAKGERCGGKRAGQTGEKIDKERLKLEDCPKRLGPQGQAFICPHCGLTVSSLFCLNLHLKTQHRKQATSMYLPGPGLNPCKRDLAGSSNRCHLCGRNFYSRSNLKKHMVVHSGRRPYSCPDCGRTFNQSSNVLRHQRSHHHALSSPNCHGVEGKGGEGMTSNRGTRQVRKRPQNMRVRVHREESIDIMNLGAERINKTLNKDLENTSAGQSASHIPFLCQVCGHGFPSHSSLEIHMLGHTTERPYRCPLCGRGFANTPNFTRHMLVHTGEKPWRCTDCGRCFNQISNLNRHCRSYGHQGSIAKGTPA